MHILQPKHIKLKPQEAKLLLQRLRINALQLPKIKKSDPALPPDTNIGDIIRIERKTQKGKMEYFRIVIL